MIISHLNLFYIVFLLISQLFNLSIQLRFVSNMFLRYKYEVNQRKKDQLQSLRAVQLLKQNFKIKFQSSDVQDPVGVKSKHVGKM